MRMRRARVRRRPRHRRCVHCDRRRPASPPAGWSCPAPVPPDTRNASRAAMTSSQDPAACGRDRAGSRPDPPDPGWPAAARVARYRSRQPRSAAGSRAGAPSAARRPSRSVHRRPTAARHRAGGPRRVRVAARAAVPLHRQRTERGCAANRFRRRHQTASGAVTNTSVVPGPRTAVVRAGPRRSVRSVAPADWSAPRCHRVHRRIRRGSPAATILGRSGAGFGGQPLADPVDQRSAHAADSRPRPRPLPDAGPAPRAPARRRRPAAIAARNRNPPRSNFSASSGSGRIAASSGSPAISATSTARSPPGDGPRTTSPTLGLRAVSSGAIAAVAAHDRTSHWRDDDDEVGGIQRRLGGFGRAAAADRTPRWRRRGDRRR